MIALSVGVVHRFLPPERDEELDAFLIRAESSDTARRTTVFVASTSDEDRAGDVVAQDWRLGEFKANPVILDNHNPYRVVGRGTEAAVRKGSGALEIGVEWDLDNPDPSIRAVGHQHLNGFRAGASVGFRSLKRAQRHELPKDHPAYREQAQRETDWGSIKLGSGFYFERNVLLELSSATIPMNPRALQRPGGAPSKALADLAAVVGEIEDPTERAVALVRQTLHRHLADELVSVLRASPETRRSVLGLLESVPLPAADPPTQYRSATPPRPVDPLLHLFPES